MPDCGLELLEAGARMLFNKIVGKYLPKTSKAVEEYKRQAVVQHCQERACDASRGPGPPQPHESYCGELMSCMSRNGEMSPLVVAGYTTDCYRAWSNLSEAGVNINERLERVCCTVERIGAYIRSWTGKE